MARNDSDGRSLTERKKPDVSRRIRLGRVGLAVVAAAVAAVTAASGPGMAAGASAAPSGGSPLPAFPQKINAAWVYDTDGPGTWIEALKDYNAQAKPGHRLTGVFPVSTSLVTTCPEQDGTQCTAADLHIDWSPSARFYNYLDNYEEAFNSVNPDAMTITPILDGYLSLTNGGYTNGFNELSQELAEDWADRFAQQFCADDRVDGIQADVEPFDVSTVNGQFYFYRQVAKNFAGLHTGDTATDPYGCVNAAHPKGRTLSTFTFATQFRPGTQGAKNMADIFSAYGNGFVLISLYDLSEAPAFALSDMDLYKQRVFEEAKHTVEWAHAAGLRYGFGLPAAASAHEYEQCFDVEDTNAIKCTPDANGATGHPMLEYTKLSVAAVNASGALNDRWYLGSSIWNWNKLPGTFNRFEPSSAPEDALEYLARTLPGARNPIGGR